MPFMHDDIRDNGLSSLTNANLTGEELHILSGAPTDRADALSKSLGQKVTPTITGPADAASNGRAMSVSAISDGDVDANGTATHWAMIDSTRLLSWNTLASSQAVTSGNTFQLPAFEFARFLDAA